MTSVKGWIISLIATVAFCAATATAGPVTIQFNSALGTNLGGVYTGIYYGTTNGVQTDFICDDFGDEIVGGQNWQANVGTNYPVSNTVQYGASTSTVPGLTTKQDYNAIAYLAEQIFANPTGPEVNYDAWAIWELNSQAAANDVLNFDPADQAGVSSALNAALANDDHFNGSLYVYTPVPQGAGQEFLSRTPEPASVFLLGSALLWLSWGLRKRFSLGR